MGTQGRQLASLSYPHKHESSTLANSYFYYDVSLRHEGPSCAPTLALSFFPVSFRPCPELPGQGVLSAKGGDFQQSVLNLR